MQNKHRVTIHPFAGYSMYPFLKPGDRLVIRKTSPADIRTGDILAARAGQGALAMHRVVQVLSAGEFITKGDCLLAADPRPVPAAAVTGKVAAIIRGKRLIQVSAGNRERFKQIYAWLSRRNLTWGCIRSNARRLFNKTVPVSGPDRRNRPRQLLNTLIRNEKEDFIWERVDLCELESAAVREGVAGYLYPLVKARGAPQEVIAIFKKHYLAIAARNLTVLARIESLEADLQTEGLDIMVLKGASLQGTVYGRSGFRFMEDVDILVRPGDQNRFVRILANQGFIQDPDRAGGFIKGNTLIDLHTDALNTDRVESRRWLFPVGMQPVWERAVPWKEGLHRIKRPVDADNLLLLAQHALKHACGRLIWLVDIWLLLKDGPRQFWADLYTRTEQLGQMRPLYQVLFLLEREFGLVAPYPFKSPAGQVPWLARQLLLFREDGKADAYAGILLPLLTIPSLKKRMAFAWESIVLNRATARKEFGGSFNSHPVAYYLYRLGFSATQCLTLFRRLAGPFFKQPRL